MPYIKGQDYQRAITRPRNAGELNYAITMLLIHYVEDKTTLGHGLTQPVNYALLNEVVGAVTSAKDEFNRRVVAPYEDTKIASNGDVYPAWLVGQGARGPVERDVQTARPTTGPLPPRNDGAREAVGDQRFSLLDRSRKHVVNVKNWQFTTLAAPEGYYRISGHFDDSTEVSLSPPVIRVDMHHGFVYCAGTPDIRYALSPFDHESKLAVPEMYRSGDALPTPKPTVATLCGHADSAGGAEFPMPPCPTRTKDFNSVDPVYQTAEETQGRGVQA